MIQTPSSAASSPSSSSLASSASGSPSPLSAGPPSPSSSNAPLVVGLCGPAGCGKTTIANLVADSYFARGATGWRPTSVISLADPLKAALRALGLTKKDNPSVYRTMAQRLGDLCRATDPDFFVRLWRRAWEDFPTIYRRGIILIDDIRFPNEAPLCDILLVVRRPGLKSPLTPEQSSHVSETWWTTAANTHPPLLNEENREQQAADALSKIIDSLLDEQTPSA